MKLHFKCMYIPKKKNHTQSGSYTIRDLELKLFSKSFVVRDPLRGTVRFEIHTLFITHNIQLAVSGIWHQASFLA